MSDVDTSDVPPESDNRPETGARKYPLRPGDPYVQDGISRGGTITGDKGDEPPEEGYGLTEAVDEDPLSTGKSDGRDAAVR